VDCTQDCGGVVKPDITFFGESLPERFFTSADRDFPMCDLLIVMGTSLKVDYCLGYLGHCLLLVGLPPPVASNLGYGW
jgi:NAD-dependent SIR2 family protein deacetylase